MNHRMEHKSISHDITFCTSECDNKCMRHISNYEFKEDERVSLADFNCKDDNIKELFETIQYFRENLDLFGSTGRDKLKTVLDLADKGIRSEYNLNNNYIPKWKVEYIIAQIQKECEKGKHNANTKRLLISAENLLKSLF